MRLVAALLEGLITAYQWTLSPILGPRCRFLPSCSDYAREAVREHGAVRGLWLGAWRLCRCHPLGGSGWDPVPPAGKDHMTPMKRSD